MLVENILTVILQVFVLDDLLTELTWSDICCKIKATVESKSKEVSFFMRSEPLEKPQTAIIVFVLDDPGFAELVWKEVKDLLITPGRYTISWTEGRTVKATI